MSFEIKEFFRGSVTVTGNVGSISEPVNGMRLVTLHVRRPALDSSDCSLMCTARDDYLLIVPDTVNFDCSELDDIRVQGKPVFVESVDISCPICGNGMHAEDVAGSRKPVLRFAVMAESVSLYPIDRNFGWHTWQSGNFMSIRTRLGNGVVRKDSDCRICMRVNFEVDNIFFRVIYPFPYGNICKAVKLYGRYLEKHGIKNPVIWTGDEWLVNFADLEFRVYGCMALMDKAGYSMFFECCQQGIEIPNKYPVIFADCLPRIC